MSTITPEQYGAQMTRLETEFMDFQLTPGRSELIWKIAMNHSFEQFEKIVTHFIATMRKPPVPQDFADAMKSESRYYTAPAPEPTIKCRKCNDLGLLSATTWDNKTLMAICSCEAAEDKSYSLPTIEMLGRNADFEPLQANWFRPSNGDSLVGIKSKMEQWKERIRQSELQWGQYALAE